MTAIDPHRLVFVGGLHRSGTTPFARALDAHPAVSGLSRTGVREDEGQHLQRVYPNAKVHGGSGRFAQSAEAHLTEQSPLTTASNADSMVRSWMPYWDLSKQLFVEKSPPNVIMGRFLQALFPGSALIVVVRHPVAVALSTKKWRRLASSNPRKVETLSQMVQHWFAAHRTLAADAPHLERLLVLHYEDLVTDPVRELARVQQFLGLSQPIPHDSLSTAHGQSYELWWERLHSRWRPGGWQRMRIEQRFGAEMMRYGYDVQDISAHHPVSHSPLAGN